MAFFINEQKFTDKEVASAIKEAKQARHEWCEQQAHEFFTGKNCRQFYHVWYYLPEIEDDGYLCLPKTTIDAVREAIDKDIAENGPYSDPDGAGDARRDIIYSLNIDVTDKVDPTAEYVTLTDIDLNDYLNCYSVRVLRFDSQSCEQLANQQLAVHLTDEEYIQILTELLYSPKQMSFDGLCKILPEVGIKITDRCVDTNASTAIFLKEMNDDVDAILEKNGGRENTPYIDLFDNPFVLMAEYNASKNTDEQ